METKQLEINTKDGKYFFELWPDKYHPSDKINVLVRWNGLPWITFEASAELEAVLVLMGEIERLRKPETKEQTSPPKTQTPDVLPDSPVIVPIIKGKRCF